MSTTETHTNTQRSELAAIRAIAESTHDEPVLMLNLNRYTAAAGYPEGENYRAYMAVLETTVARTGGKVLWRTPVSSQPIGCDHDRIDEILAVWYPSHAAFLGLLSLDGAEALWQRREQCVANAVIHRCPADRYPLQP